MTQISIAANRFGYGLKSGDAPPGDATAWLNAQFRSYRASPQAYSGHPTRADIANEIADFMENNRMKRGMNQDRAQIQVARQATRKNGREAYTNLVAARFQVAVESDTPFVERLVHLWANHFAVSADKLTTVGLAGLLELEAIRPHVLGRFGDLLLAVEQHPAMLLYLDQAQSIGPNSPVGARVQARDGKQGGLNENLAREILELHTLGVRSVYTQADVTEFARALTGWTVAGITRGPASRVIGPNANPGDFAFAPALHEPGERTIIGRRYGAAGEGQGRAILADLARHPATAKHISTKLARHFAGDDPPAALVARLEACFLQTGGDFPSLYQVLIEAPEIWAKSAPKFKTPWDWMVSAHRALGLSVPQPHAVAATFVQLGQPVWRPGSPAGFDDVAASWAGPDALFRRVVVAERLAMRAGISNPSALGTLLFPSGLGAATITALARAESPVQGTALLLVSPEFLRR